ncbi:hypothetical protein [Anaerotignum sp.]
MSYDSNTARIYTMMEHLNVSIKEIAKDYGFTVKKTKDLIDSGLPNEETDELCDRIICIAIERERKLICNDDETGEEIMQYLMETPSKEILYRLGWYRDTVIIKGLEMAEIEARQLAEKAENIVKDLYVLQRVFWQGKAAKE